MMSQNHPIFENEDLKTYFDSLAPVVQEAVFQSGVPIQSVEQLRRFAEGYTEK